MSALALTLRITGDHFILFYPHRKAHLNVAGICTAFFLLSSIAHPKVYSLPRSRIANILKFLSENPVAIARGEGSSI